MIRNEETTLWFDYHADTDLVPSGRLNHHIGWILLAADFARAIWLDPWSFNEHNTALAGGQRTAAMQAQIMVAAMAFLQIATGRFLNSTTVIGSRRRISASLTALGSVIYGLGYALSLQSASAGGLIFFGALMNFTGFIYLAHAAKSHSKPESVALSVICFGMLLVGLMGLLQWEPELFPSSYLGPDDGFRLRMLRLAQVAGIALPALTLLFRELGDRADAGDRDVRWGRIGMLCGTIGMPTLLANAALLSGALEILLPIPASAIFAGTLCATWVARKHARPLELWGWLLIALSMAAGLVMGLYAFSFPFIQLHILGAYNDYARRLIRLAHIYGIILGMSSILVSREIDNATPRRFLPSLGKRLLVAGSSATLIAIFLVAIINLTTAVLSLGPAMITVAILLCPGPRLSSAASARSQGGKP